MKSSYSFGFREPDGSGLKRSGKSGRWGLNVAQRQNQTVEDGIPQIDRSTASDISMRSFIYVQAAAKLVSTAYVLNRSKRFMGGSKQRQMTSVPLPPISRSKAISGKGQDTASLPAPRKDSAKPKGYITHLKTTNMKTENVFHMLDIQCGKANQESNRHNKISVAGSKTAVHNSETRNRQNKEPLDGQPTATLTEVQQKKNCTGDPRANESSTVMPVKVKLDAPVCEARQQRGLCSNDSAIETESEGSENKGRLERPKEDSDEEYYTDWRIAEWVQKVNSSFFATRNYELKCLNPADEQDVATMKIRN
ncbi:hypothetical protein Q5P01_020082 [Channa striata]|uniref:Uncharacterized protein n=1 Tax=Channa striata TaxID=64152 RepID=A0AA88LWZ8_CHASR|nr:hypothetical protein Q5P01_020082 [Channa striata]